jgi:hypothetical protein
MIGPSISAVDRDRWWNICNKIIWDRHATNINAKIKELSVASPHKDKDILILISTLLRKNHEYDRA